MMPGRYPKPLKPGTKFDNLEVLRTARMKNGKSRSWVRCRCGKEYVTFDYYIRQNPGLCCGCLGNRNRKGLNSKEVEKAVLKLIGKDMTMTEIGRVVGVTRQMVSKIFIKHGGRKRARSMVARNHGAEIPKMVEKGMSLKTIAESLGTADVSVAKFLKDSGFKRPSKLDVWKKKLAGNRRLVLLKCLPNHQGLFRCGCGKNTVKSLQNVHRGNTKSCGCLVYDYASWNRKGR